MNNDRQAPENPFSGPLAIVWSWADNLQPTVRTWAGNFQRNTSSAFSTMRTKDYVRLIAIVGGYLLLRPYLLKLGARAQEQQHAKESSEGDASMSPNELRGAEKIEIPGVEDNEESEGEEGEGGKSEWGRGARLRQRKFIRQALKAHEDRLRAEEEETASDKEIEQFLMEEYAMAE